MLMRLGRDEEVLDRFDNLCFTRLTQDEIINMPVGMEEHERGMHSGTILFHRAAHAGIRKIHMDHL